MHDSEAVDVRHGLTELVHYVAARYFRCGGMGLVSHEIIRMNGKNLRRPGESEVGARWPGCRDSSSK